ncbi:alpha-protein kinase 1 isoform X2 [Pseudorasbora parva]|uniref:alpha-protein kinase 1 isoform X2 n=1 Tax=Pseudorasbora parva TaxID=51549 RepID=UPI00351E3CA5
MSGQEVALLLQECLRYAVAGPEKDTATPPLRQGSLPDELSALLEEAADQKWPFVEEKWQYKQSVTSEDKINSSDLVRKHLPQLLVFLRDSIAADEPRWAFAAVFLLDRLLYWMDGSLVLLKIAKALHRRYPDVPIAPQVIIRQARVYLNTGSWTYGKASDQTLVQAVSLQVRGQVLQTLGLWSEAAELMWASLIGFYALPQPDKKGIGTSLGLLANILTSMTDRDFAALQEQPHIDLSFLGETRHRLLSAARAAKMAAVFSQYGSLYVLTNVVAQGTCLLSYSFSKHCPVGDQQVYMALAKEAFEIGLLTKTAGDSVTSKLELHTFLKAAYSLCRAQRWMSGASEAESKASAVCLEALALFLDFCSREDSSLCAQIMARIQHIKSLLNVKTFRNSDPRSFIPDSYRSLEFGPVLFTLRDFAKALDAFGKHHKSVCEAFESSVPSRSCSTAQCLTAFQTDTAVPATADPTSSSGSLIMGEQSSLGSFEALDGSREANVVSPSNPNTFRHNKGSQSQSQRKPITSEDAENNAPSTSGSHRRDLWKNRTTLSSSWEHVSGRSQSSIETAEDDPNGSYQAPDGIREANVVSQNNRRSVPNNFRHNKGSQAKPFTSEDAEDNAPNTSGSHRRDLWKNRTSLSSSWEHGSGRSQSSIETAEDDPSGSYQALDGTREANLVSPSNQSSVPNNFRHNKGSQSNSLPMQETATTEDLEDQWSAVRKTPEVRTSSSSFSSGSLWEHVSGPSQSSVETVEDFEDPSQDSNGINKGDQPKGGSTSSFSLCDSLGSHSSWQKLSVSPVANAERLDKLDRHTKAPPPQIEESLGRTSTESDPFEELGFEHLSDSSANPSGESACNRCFKNCIMGSAVLTAGDSRALLAGVCHGCLIRRLPNTPLKPLDEAQLETAYDAMVLKFSKASGVWMGWETSVYIGKAMGVQGKQRRAIELQYLHQEQLLSSYVGKEYLKDKGLHAHLDDVERQMTAQHYVTEFNKRLYDNNVTTQIFFIPSEVLLVLQGRRILTCLSAEPFMSGTFVKLTNNTRAKAESDATKYGLAFGHFTYEFSRGQEVVVDLQGWISASGKGLTYLTDPQIHSLRKPRSSNFQQSGINNFLKHQHGDECNEICRAAGLTDISHTHTP